MTNHIKSKERAKLQKERKAERKAHLAFLNDPNNPGRQAQKEYIELIEEYEKLIKEKRLENLKKSHPIIDHIHQGTTFEDAIIIKGVSNSGDGVALEHLYLKEIFPGYNLVNQDLDKKGNRTYDIMEIENNSNKYKVYFDITEFFGK